MGQESLSTGVKEIKGRARYGSIDAGNMIFLHMNVQDLRKKLTGIRVEIQK